MRSFIKRRIAAMGLGGKYLIGVSGLLLIGVGVLFSRQFQTEKTFIMGQLESQARLLGRQVLLTRSWLSDQGGVYVRWTSGNPHLPGSELSLNGCRLQLCNPALVTRELSKYAMKQGVYRFRLTSTRLINPDNAPDETERRALADFAERGAAEVNLLQELDGQKVFRHIRPLFIEAGCLGCHREYEGYRVGDLRGCLSVIIPSDTAESRIRQLSWALFRDAVFIFLSTLAVLFILNYNLTVRPLKRLRRQMRAFEQDINFPVPILRRQDEIGELAVGFAELAAALRRQHEEMEKKVARATRELVEVNRELNEANLGLRRRDAMKTDFLATVSHELRTPLTNIQGGVDYLLQTVDNEDQRSYLQLIERNIRGLIAMVSRLLDLARIELDQIELEYEALDLGMLLQEVALLFRAEAARMGIEIRCPAIPEVRLYADYRRLNQVFINLIDNALRFSPPGQTVEMRLLPEADGVVVEVVDHGSGIEARELEEIFTRYRCRHSKDGGGSGIGLAVAKGLIEAHGGRLTVVSSPGVETVFTVYLPRQSPAGPAATPVMEEKEEGKKDDA
ncbi:MAG TPA: DUF3365 domain-containing protein [Proteobacteria bacterium]|nr:DUF3365 domain-containing protein [Pseudomonadota bacterium]